MFSLYIDTHYIKLVIAIFKDGKLLNIEELESNRHSENTIPLLKKVLENNKVSLLDIKEIWVINGPGSFTGVRIGVVVAKILGYTKNIKIKPISYLQVLSLNYDKEVILGIKDRNGSFIGKFSSTHELIGDYYYLENKKLNKEDKIIYETYVDYSKLGIFMQKIKCVDPHILVPLYVKKIEVDKNDKRG